MKFWKFSLPVLAGLLAAVSASGPSDGEAIADPNSAVVKLGAAEFSTFIKENPLVLAEFFAPWCGYCKQLAPEFVSAADQLNESYPNIKLAQIDCTEEEELCQEHGIRGYPTLKIIRGSADNIEDYEGPRQADGIMEYMIEQSKPAVQAPESVEELNEILDSAGSRSFIIQVLPAKAKNAAALAESFDVVANNKRKDLSFISVTTPEQINALAKKLPNHKLKAKGLKKAHYYLVRGGSSLEDASHITSSSSFDEEALATFVDTELVPYFGEINRDTYMLYMNSPLPIGYYFYNTEEQREAMSATFEKLGKEHRGKINFVGLDATQFGRHAEVLNMDQEIIPLFAIQKVNDNVKFGINQTEHPDPSAEVIEQFVSDYFEDKLTAIVKSEELPTAEEIASAPVIKLVGYNHADIVGDLTKDVFVKYYAPWCGHCKTLAPKWEELAEIYGSNKPDAEVLIAHIDHTANDVKTPFAIEGYPTLVLYPANGEIDEESGIRKPIVFDKSREIDDLIAFIKKEGGHKVDGAALQKAFEKTKEERESASKREEEAEIESPEAEDDVEEDSEEEDDEINDEL